jgi:DAK2 domain fusion protein YloV
VAVLEVLDGAAARRWADAAVAALGAARAEIDALNVFPVPDGDTGTNLHLTLEHAVEALRALDDDAALGAVSDTLARGALMGARGNSGIIAAQLLRGWADELAGRTEADADVARSAFVRADAEAWEAVAHPVEGTLLSVSRAAARAAREAPGPLAAVVRAAADAAREALAATPDQLPVLREAGVVDAGGMGLVVLLDALAGVVTGLAPSALPHPLAVAGESAAAAVAGHGCSSAGGPAYEVMYLLDAADAEVPALRTRLGGLGDSLVVVGGKGLWHVHVHTDDAGAAVEAGIDAGRPHRVRITHLGDQVRPGGEGARPAAGVGVVACAAGPGLAALFSEAGAVALQPGTGRRASTAELLRAVRETGTGSVVVLPNDPGTLAVAQAAAAVARGEGTRVTVVPTRAQVQGLAALAVHDRARDLDEDVAQMSAAAGATRHGAVTVAARDAITMAGRCRTGDVLGVLDGDFAVIGTDLGDVACEVVDRLLAGGGELVTLVLGEGTAAGLADDVRSRVRARRPEVEVHVLDGGQPRYPLLVGVE